MIRASGGAARTSGLRLDARQAAARWHAPSWLAAAASLLLFAGVLALATGERNWAVAPETSPSLAQSELAARDSQRSPSPPPANGVALAGSMAAKAWDEREEPEVVVGAIDPGAATTNPTDSQNAGVAALVASGRAPISG